MAASVLLLPALTPPTYHRIVSPTLHIPTDPQVSVPVGLLACQRDPLLRELATTVVSCTVSQAPAVPSNGRKSKEKTPMPPAETLLEVILHDTVLFPEGGGQPSDVGLLTTSDKRVWKVIEIKRHGGHAVHYVSVPKEDVEAALQAFHSGAEVVASLGEEGYKKRLDHSCMHTSQHLLSAVLETRLKLPTLSWSLSTWPNPAYVEIPRNMTLEEIAFAQEAANGLVFEGRNVHVEVEEFDRDKIIEAKIAEGRGAEKGPPVDYTGGVKRTVIIDGVDRSLCCGTHFPTIHNLQLFIISHLDSVARSSTTSARLYFLAGPRLIEYVMTTHGRLTTAAATLSCGAPLVPERVEQIVEERKRMTKRVDDVEAELAAVIAKQLAAAVTDGQDDGVLHLHRTDDSVNALGFLSSIATALASEIASAPSPPSFLILLSSSPSVQTSTSTNVMMIFGSDEQKVKAVGEGLKGKLAAKGGGKGSRWSGKSSGVWSAARGTVVAGILADIRGQ
ncbi:ThrRS/AlaRS common domain-containing protein [Obba rivulosa]|uniref:ThrRS/AlaRS common domain-containing protein n=1 Tax=Obba rivulosa TaxID=1052685 RepID=A0A8E2B1Q5_9APHY|nr:ThrRS/AlaRS common domain-containing protein [Obba rivulosa]